MTENLFSDIPETWGEELVDVLASNEHVRIERIVSNGQSSPPGFWYDQAETEWVIVLRGEAKLLIEGNSEAFHLKRGNHIEIAAHRRHRVEWTSPDQPTVWLAVFYS